MVGSQNSQHSRRFDSDADDDIEFTIHEFSNPAPGMWLFTKDPKNCFIYRVPNSIRRVNPEAYTPQLIIIGPLHHCLKSQALDSIGNVTNTKSMGYLNMEHHKKIYLAKFAERLEDREHHINELRRKINFNKDRIKASYSESTTWIESQEFVDMILHDSVFIVEFILRTMYARYEKTGDPLVDEPCLKNTIKEDLILLENQLPYFILEELFAPIIPSIRKMSFRELVITYFVSPGKINDNSEFKHFTDLFRLVHVETLPKTTPEDYNNRLEHMYTAEKLHSGGVEFEAVEEKFSLEVSFKNGRLKMPCLRFDDKVEMRLRNIMALEQCYYPYHAYVCNYIIFLDHLIDTNKDVEVLVEKGIIKNWIGQDHSVANVINRLGLGIIEVDSYYSHIAAKVNGHYKNRMNRSRALLKRVYFGNLWTGTATVAATFLLLMTLIQAVTVSL